MAETWQTAPAEIRINTAEIPDYVRDRLAVATMAFVRSILKQPGGREALEARAVTKYKGGGPVIEKPLSSVVCQTLMARETG